MQCPPYPCALLRLPGFGTSAFACLSLVYAALAKFETKVLAHRPTQEGKTAVGWMASSAQQPLFSTYMTPTYSQESNYISLGGAGESICSLNVNAKRTLSGLACACARSSRSLFPVIYLRISRKQYVGKHYFRDEPLVQATTRRARQC